MSTAYFTARLLDDYLSNQDLASHMEQSWAGTQKMQLAHPVPT